MMKQLLRSTDIGHGNLEYFFKIVDDMEKCLHLLKRGYVVSSTQSMTGKLMGTLFLEPSTRTRLIFEAAMKRMGGDVISVPECTSSSCHKGESIKDAIRTACQYVDVLVIRTSSPHGNWGGNFDCPIINAGDGANEHPTQALVDAYTIHQHFNTLEGLHIAFVGDLKHGRAVHSLFKLLRQYRDNTLYLYGSPIPGSYIQFNNDKVIEVASKKELIEILPKLDILYMTRIQAERGSEGPVPFILGKEMAQKLDPNAVIMHPMPRLAELHPSVDEDPRAIYFEQSKNGVSVRMAILSWIFGL